jgi:hypothetical protein
LDIRSLNSTLQSGTMSVGKPSPTSSRKTKVRPADASWKMTRPHQSKGVVQLNFSL